MADLDSLDVASLITLMNEYPDLFTTEYGDNYFINPAMLSLPVSASCSPFSYTPDSLPASASCSPLSYIPYSFSNSANSSPLSYTPDSLPASASCSPFSYIPDSLPSSASSSPLSYTPELTPPPCGVESPVSADMPPQLGSGFHDLPDFSWIAEAPARPLTPLPIEPAATAPAPRACTSIRQYQRASGSRSQSPPIKEYQFVYYQHPGCETDHAIAPPVLPSPPTAPTPPTAPYPPTFSAAPMFVHYGEDHVFHPPISPQYSSQFYFTAPPEPPHPSLAYYPAPSPLPVQHLLPIPPTSSLCIRTRDTGSASDVTPHAAHYSPYAVPTHRVVDREELVQETVCLWRGCGKRMARGVSLDHVRTDHLARKNNRSDCFWGKCNGKTQTDLERHLKRTHLKLEDAPCPKCGVWQRGDALVRHMKTCMKCTHCDMEFPSDLHKEMHVCLSRKPRKSPSGKAASGKRKGGREGGRKGGRG